MTVGRSVEGVNKKLNNPLDKRLKSHISRFAARGLFEFLAADSQTHTHTLGIWILVSWWALLTCAIVCADGLVPLTDEHGFSFADDGKMVCRVGRVMVEPVDDGV